LPFERPKFTAIAQINEDDFAVVLGRALEASGEIINLGLCTPSKLQWPTQVYLSHRTAVPIRPLPKVLRECPDSLECNTVGAEEQLQCPMIPYYPGNRLMLLSSRASKYCPGPAVLLVTKKLARCIGSHRANPYGQSDLKRISSFSTTTTGPRCQFTGICELPSALERRGQGTGAPDLPGYPEPYTNHTKSAESAQTIV
jgi:hypothetical protein